MRLPKFTLRRPAAAPVGVFDDWSIAPLGMSLAGMQTVIVPSAPAITCLHPAVLIAVLRRASILDWRFILSQAIRLRLGSVLGQLHHLYLLALVESIKPRVLVTMIDNSPAFHFLSRHYRLGRCIAVQNGSRFPTDVDFLLPQPPHPASKVYFQDYFCFSDFEPAFFSARPDRYHAERFFPVGSLKVAQYLAQQPAAPTTSDFEICLVSQWTGLTADTHLTQGMVQATSRLDSLLAGYARTTGARLAVALRTTQPAEADYYRAKFGLQCHVGQYDPASHSTFALMRRSALAVCVNSTAGFESLAWKQKILFCNASESIYQDLPIPGIWSLSQPDAGGFADRVDHLLKLGRSEYEAELAPYLRKLMRYDRQHPAHQALREHIQVMLEKP